MSPAPHVSVVLPFRDAGATLDAALRSIAAQTLPAFECLLIDNGSVDASVGIARATARRDPRFRVLQAHGSLVEALNAGIAAARAPLIARMDADDLAHPARLERQLQALQADRNLSVVSCLVESFPAALVRDGMRRYETWLNALRTPESIRAALFVESPIAHPSVVVTRSALDAVGGYREIDGPEDYDLWLRLLLRGHRAAKVDAVLHYWRESPGRLSRVDRRYDRRRFFATKLAHFPTAVGPETGLQIWGAGPTGRAWARALGPRGYTVHRFVDIAAPRWGRSLHGAPVYPPHVPDRQAGFALVAAGTPGAREGIESWLHAYGLRAGTDYLAVA